MTRIRKDVLLENLARRGLEDEVTALHALRSTLAVLGERLVDDEAEALAAVLPQDIARSIEDVDYDTDFNTAELFERVRRREHSTPARSKESAEIVLSALGECLSRDRRVRIARALPERAAELLLGDRELGEPPPHGIAPRAPRIATLASARPGSTHPLSESAPPGGQAHSVARNPSPHADTKLSTAKGLTQEQLDETLGAGRPPGPARSIADAGRR